MTDSKPLNSAVNALPTRGCLADTHDQQLLADMFCVLARRDKGYAVSRYLCPRLCVSQHSVDSSACNKVGISSQTGSLRCILNNIVHTILPVTLQQGRLNLRVYTQAKHPQHDPKQTLVHTYALHSSTEALSERA